MHIYLYFSLFISHGIYLPSLLSRINKNAPRCFFLGDCQCDDKAFFTFDFSRYWRIFDLGRRHRSRRKSKGIQCWRVDLLQILRLFSRSIQFQSISNLEQRSECFSLHLDVSPSFVRCSSRCSTTIFLIHSIFTAHHQPMLHRTNIIRTHWLQHFIPIHSPVSSIKRMEKSIHRYRFSQWIRTIAQWIQQLQCQRSWYKRD